MGAVLGRLVRAEWTKLLTTRVWIGLLLGSCVLVGGFAALFTGFAGGSGSGLPAVGTPEYEQLVLAVSANATILFVVLGIIGTTQEYRHRTATPTFLASPHRGRVVIAKLIAYGLAAVPMALVVIAVDVLVVLGYAGAKGAGVALVLYTLIGVGVGALLRNQVGAIVGSLVYLFVVESLIQGIPATSGAYKWLPGGALQAVIAGTDTGDVLSAWQGGLLLLGYGLVAAVLGTVLAVRRDVV
jgi:hypothetical protein